MRNLWVLESGHMTLPRSLPQDKKGIFFFILKTYFLVTCIDVKKLEHIFPNQTTYFDACFMSVQLRVSESILRINY